MNPIETFRPLETRDNDPFLVEVIRRMLSRNDLDPWLPFPQNATCFSFGAERRPLPIGALRLLWEAGMPWSQPCPACGDTLRMVSFGGLLAKGGGRCHCNGCGGAWYQPIGGLGTIARLLGSSPLAGTPFRMQGGLFGGAIGSDGAQLLAALGLPPRPLAKSAVSVTVSGKPLVLPVDIPTKDAPTP